MIKNSPQASQPKLFLSNALPILIGTLVAGNFTLAKMVVSGGPSPFEVFYWQLIGATVLLATFLLARGQRLSVSPQHLKYYMFSGILGMSGPQLVAYTALEHIPAGLFTILITLSPLLTFIIGSFYQRQLLPLYKLIGIAVGLVGISFATLSDINLQAASYGWLIFALATPLLLASGNIYRNKAYPAQQHPLSLATGTLLSQVVILGPIFWLKEATYSPLQFSGSVSGIIFFMGLLSAFSYLLTFELQKHTDGVGTSQIGYFVTLSGILLGAWMFDEKLSLNLLASIILIFTGLAITNGNLSLPWHSMKQLKRFIAQSQQP